MYLVRMVYASRVTEGFNENEIESILTSARKNNTKSSVTGILCFNHNYFLQCLEGSRRKVNATYHSILNDPRHNEIILLDYKEIVEREFSEWNMGYMPESSLTKPITMRFSGSPDFNPFDMSGESAHQLMITLSKTVPVA